MYRFKYNRLLCLIVVVAFSFNSTKLSAAENITGTSSVEIQACANASFEMNNDESIYFWQHLFEDGTRDLVLTNSTNTTVTRVTFSNAKTGPCPYQALAITEGVGWGWHLAWADEKKLYIARMDSEAWVSSVPKKIASEDIVELRFTQDADSLVVHWKAAQGEAYHMQSDDDGRNWPQPSISSKCYNKR